MKPGGVKRTAEGEADDSERADRRSWENYVEPASSNQAPDSHTAANPIYTQMVPVAHKRDLEVPSEESESPQKLPNISSICLGIGSAYKIGELNAREYAETSKPLPKNTIRRSSREDVSSMSGRSSPATKT